MANSNTSLNGYEFGRSPRTQAPFWGGGSEGAAIDDTGVYTDKTWSSQKISDELDEKADASDLVNYAKVTSVYNKSESYSKAEVDALIDAIPSVDAYTKTQTDNLLANKANVSDVYTKTEADSLLAGKAGVNSVYTKGQTDRLLTDKANAADVYTKTQADNLLSDKADSADVYTKSQVYTKSEVDLLISDIPAVDAYTKSQTDALLANKADKSDTYTKTQVDALIPDVSGYAKSTAVYLKSQTYNKTEVDALLSQIPAVDAYTKTETDALLANKANSSDVYTKTQTDNLLANKANSADVYTKSQTDNLLSDKANSSDVYTKTQTDNLLANKANSADVYTKSQVYTKSETDALIPDVSGYAKSTAVYLKTETYTKAEVDALISGGGGGGAEIDDTTTSTTKVWSSNKTWNIIKGAQNASAIYRGLAKYDNNHGLNGTFDANHTYSTGNITVTLNKYDGTASSYNLAPTRLPWRYMASPAYSYPVNDAQWKSYILGDTEVFMTLSGNVAASGTLKNPYLFIQTPRGSGVQSISVTYNNGDWTVYGANEDNLTQAVSQAQSDIYDLQDATYWTEISWDITTHACVTEFQAFRTKNMAFITFLIGATAEAMNAFNAEADDTIFNILTGLPKSISYRVNGSPMVAVATGFPVQTLATFIRPDYTSLGTSKPVGTTLPTGGVRVNLQYAIDNNE